MASTAGLISAAGSFRSTTGTRVRVAIDARPLASHGNGISRLVAEVVRSLHRAAGRVEPILVGNRPIHPSHDLEDVPTIVDAAWSRLPGTIWYVMRMNALAKASGSAVVWGTAHVLPPRDSALRYVVSLHDLVHRIFPASMRFSNRLISALLVSRSLNAADFVVTLSDTTLRDLTTQLGPFQSRARTVLPGVPEASRPSVLPAKLAGLPPRFIFTLGSLEPRKNVDGLLRCFAELTQLQPDLHLVLAGADSWKTTSLLRLIDREPLKGKVLRLGKLSDAQIVRCFERCEAFVMSSHYEGFGLPILEAAEHCPILLSEIPIFEEVSSYLSGVRLVDFSDASSSSREIDSWLRSAPPIARLRAPYREILSWGHAAAAYSEVFLEAATRP